MKYAGLKENDWPKVIQLVFVPKVGLECTDFWFLGQLIHYYTNWFSDIKLIIKHEIKLILKNARFLAERWRALKWSVSPENPLE